MFDDFQIVSRTMLTFSLLGNEGKQMGQNAMFVHDRRHFSCVFGFRMQTRYYEKVMYCNHHE